MFRMRLRLSETLQPPTLLRMVLWYMLNSSRFCKVSNAGRRTDFRDKKIERFFWRDFSGEKFLPENRFLVQ